MPKYYFLALLCCCCSRCRRYIHTAFYCMTLLTRFFWWPLWPGICLIRVVSWKLYTYSAHAPRHLRELNYCTNFGTPSIIYSPSEWRAKCIEVGWFRWAQNTSPNLLFVCDYFFNHQLIFCSFCMKNVNYDHSCLFKSLEFLIMDGMYISLNCWSINGLTQNFTCQLQSTCVMKSSAHLHLPFWFVKIKWPANV